MRVVSLVPSWTETLLAAGCEVVGRTRFCIHPRARVGSVPIVGGTKDWDLEKINALRPDLILLDRQENPKFMSELSPCPTHATDVQSISSLIRELELLGRRLDNPELLNFAERWREVSVRTESLDWQRFPGLIEWGEAPKGAIERVVYMIWQNPWMAVSADTFIGSMLAQLGVSLEIFNEKYPKIDLASYAPESTVLLFSSEPFPFLKRKEALKKLGFSHALIDGEKFSWFGLRSLKFLEDRRDIEVF